MTITLRQLEIFEKVAKCEHVTRAGSQLFITQSAVSMAIAELERLAGAPLFERYGKRLLLNDRGRKILPEVVEVIRRTREIEQFLNDSVGEPRGTLKVGASTTIGNYILPDMVADFSKKYSRAKVYLIIGNAEQIENALENGDLDLGIIEGIPHSGVLDSAPWKNDELVVVVGKGHPWAARKTATVNMLGTAQWIMREKGSGTREVFEIAMAKDNIEFSIALELGNTEAVKKAIEAGLGVGCLSGIAVRRELEHGWLVKLKCPIDLRRTLLVQTRKSGFKTRLLQEFVSLLNQHQDS